MILAACAGEEAVVADAVEPARQGVEKKAADELVGRKGHDLLPSGTGLAVVLVAEGDPGFVEPEEAAVRYRNAVGVEREVSENGHGPGEGGPGHNDQQLFETGRASGRERESEYV